MTLRPWRSSDAPDVFHACLDPDIQHFTRVPVPYTEQHAREFVTLGPQQGSAGSAASFAATDAGPGGLLGAIGLQQPSADGREVGVGYWIAFWARGRGSTARALGLLTRWALAEGRFSRVVLEAEEGNAGSNGVASAAGHTRTDLQLQPVELKGRTRWMVRWVRVAVAADAGPAMSPAPHAPR